MIENIRLAFQGIWGHKMRSVLTMLGIIIGIAAIITIVSTIQGTNEQIKENLIGAGNNVVTVNLNQSGYSYDMGWNAIPEGVRVITEETRQELKNISGVEEVSLYNSRGNSESVYYQNTGFNGETYGIDMHYLSVYGYQAFKYYHENDSFIVHAPKPELSTAENILHMLRNDSQYTELEARILDIALILHAEHGGGNNSTFTTHVVTSSGTDTYSTVAASLGALKGPKHGGANIKVTQMFEDMKKNIKNWNDDKEIEQYLSDLLNKKAFDKSGLIYGMGHAVYSLSDPRANVFKSFVESLSKEKGREDEFNLYSRVERLAPQVIASERKMYKGVSANVDFYSGFVYSMLDLPMELYTPMFAIARIAGWSAHRIEELVNPGKIIRPAYKSIAPHKEYVPLDSRD